MNKKKLIELYKEESTNVFGNIPTSKIVRFVDMIFEILEKQKNKLKILIGNIVMTISDNKNYCYRSV